MAPPKNQDDTTPKPSVGQGEALSFEQLRAVKREERGALIFAIFAVGIILLVSIPCCAYFGLGLAQGVHTLQSGDPHNPARAPRKNFYKPNRQYPAPRRPTKPTTSVSPRHQPGGSDGQTQGV